MDDKVRRGLGLVVVGVLAALLGGAFGAYSDDGAAAAGGIGDIGEAFALAGMVAGPVGLGFIAWGLLRPRS